MKLAKQEDIDLVKASGLLDEQWYRERYPEVVKLGIDPVEHYLWIGGRLRRLPSRAFLHSDFAIDDVSHIGGSKTPPLLDFIKKHGCGFDKSWYLKRYKDVAAAGVDPYSHYVKNGRREGRSPNAIAEAAKHLDAEWYAAEYGISPDIASPLLHFFKYGKSLGRRPSQEFAFPNPHHRYTEPEYGGQLDTFLKYDEFTRLPSEFTPSIAVHMHIFHRDVLQELASYVNNIPEGYTVYISIPVGKFDPNEIRDEVAEFLSGCKNIVVREFENRGRDIAPFVVGFSQDLLKYDLVLHIHSKKTKHNPAYAGWRKYLLHYVAGNQNIVRQIINNFGNDQGLAGFFPPYHPTLRAQPNWGTNRGVATEISVRLGLPAPPEMCPDYPAGSFFWIRPQKYRQLFAGGLSFDDFAPELGQVDGTLAHAIERLFGAIPLYQNARVSMQYVDVAYNMTNYYSKTRHARSDGDRTEEIEGYRLKKEERKAGARIAVATAITGGFDPLALPRILDSDVDYVCFSNSELDGYGVFDVRTIPYHNDDPRRVARFAKTNLLHLLPEYDYVVWIDANVQLRCSVHKFVDEVKYSGKLVAGLHHPVRENYLDEADVAIKQKLDDVHIIKSQLDKYALNPRLQDERLIETNFMVFAANPLTKRFTDQWWSEIENFSRRDQLSINFASLMSGVEIHPFFTDGSSCRDTKFLRMFSHGTAPTPLRSFSKPEIPCEPEKLVQVPDFAALCASSEDATICCDEVRINEENVNGTLPDNPNNPRDLEQKRLANGVSVANWLPSKWSAQEWNATVGLSKLSNAVCFGGVIQRTRHSFHDYGQLVLTRSHRLLEASYGVWNGEKLLPSDLLTPAGENYFTLERYPNEKLLGEYMLLGSIQPHFGHTVLEGLGRLWPLFQGLEFPSHLKFLVYEPSLRDFQFTFLEHAGIAKERVQSIPSKGAVVEKLWVPDSSIRSHRWISKLQGKCWKAISDSVFMGIPTKKTYLSRTNISERPLENEHEVIDLFSKAGFEIVSPEKLSVDQQIQLAAESHTIAGPVGSQLYLGSFQKPGGKKIVIAPSNFYAKDDQMISSVIGGTCKVIFGSKIDNFADRSERRWTTDLDVLRSELAHI